MSELSDSSTANLERIIKIANGGLQQEEESPGDTDYHLDTFAIVCVWSFTDEDGDECESYSVWSESRRTHVQLGILDSGTLRLKMGIQHD